MKSFFCSLQSRAPRRTVVLTKSKVNYFWNWFHLVKLMIEPRKSDQQRSHTIFGQIKSFTD